MYYIYKGTFSIVLFTVADSHYNVTYADVDCQGHISDGSAFKQTSFSKTMKSLSAEPLPRRTLAVPFVFVADDAFALSVNTVKPYAGHNLGSSTPQKIFNYRLHRTSIIVEKMFCIVS